MKSWLPFLFVLLIFSSAGFSSSRNRRPHGAVVFDESPWMFERDESDDSEEEEGLPEMELIFENEYIM